MTWLDWFVRHRAELARGTHCGPDQGRVMLPEARRDALAAFARETALAAKGEGTDTSHASTLFSGCLVPFVQAFLPPELRGEPDRAPALGLVLTREAADLLADADPPSTDPWRRRVFGAREKGGSGLSAVYVDIPHGALRVAENLQLRAMLATPWTRFVNTGGCEVGPTTGAAAREDMVLVALVATAPGSERPRGVVFAAVDAEGTLGVNLPNGTLVGFLEGGPTPAAAVGSDGAKLVSVPFYSLVLERAVRFLRLVLAFHEYGPDEARSPIGKTPADVAGKNRNKPKKGESIFAMVRLSAPSNRLGRPPCTNGATRGWLLTARQDVSGHFRLQPHGSGGSLRKLIWVDAYARGPKDVPAKPRAVRL